MDTSGFYNNSNGEIFYGPNYVLNMDFELRAEFSNTYEYPVFGWYWFDSEDKAYEFFGIEKPIIDSPSEQNTI